MLEYMGIDWLAMVLTMVAIWQIGNKHISGFYLMIIGNSAWVILGFLTASMALVVANLIFIGMNVRAILKWSRPETDN